MKRLDISIAMCTFNGAPFLAQQLESIARQNRLPDELVIFDDGSADETRHILARFTETVPFPFRTHVNSPTLGSTRNFEQAIQACEGDLIVLSDQDDVWDRQKLAVIERAFLEDERLGMVFSDADVVDQHLEPLGYRLWSTVGFGAKARRAFQAYPLNVLLRRFVITGATMAFRTDLRDCVLPLPGSPPGAWIHDAWISLLKACFADIHFISRPLIMYRLMNRLTSVFIANSEALANKYRRVLDPNKITVVYQAVTDSPMAAQSTPRKECKRQRALNCVVVGSISQAKGQGDAIMAIAELVGSGLDVGTYRRGLRRPRLRVVFEAPGL